MRGRLQRLAAVQCLAIVCVALCGVAPRTTLAQTQQDREVRQVILKDLGLYEKQGYEVALKLGRRKLSIAQADQIYLANWNPLLGKMPAVMEKALTHFKTGDVGRAAWMQFAEPMLESMEDGGKHWDAALSGKSSGNRRHPQGTPAQRQLAQRRADVAAIRQAAERYFSGGDDRLIARIDRSNHHPSALEWANRVYPRTDYPPAVGAALERSRRRAAEAAQLAEARRGAVGRASPGTGLPPMPAAGGITGSKTPAEMSRWAIRQDDGWETVMLPVYFGWEDASIQGAGDPGLIVHNILFGEVATSRNNLRLQLGAHMWGLKAFCPALVAPYDRAIRFSYPSPIVVPGRTTPHPLNETLARQRIERMRRFSEAHGCGPTTRRYVENAVAYLTGQLMPHRASRK